MSRWSLVLLIATTLSCEGPPPPRPTIASDGEAAQARFDRGRQALRAGDAAEAARHFGYAAEQGLPAAQYGLGVLYALGQGVPRDRDEALSRYVAAAELAGAEAQYRLGEKFDQGVRGRADGASSRSWLDRLSRLGEATNPLRVGADYPFGIEGLAEDPTRAAVWYERAARLSHVMAWYRLGRMYIEGRGVDADRIRAHMFLSLCAELDLGDAAAWTAKLVETMSADDLAASRRLAQEWKASTPPPAPVAPKGDLGRRHGSRAR